MAFTPLQSRFVTEYLVDLNATKAAERAGYSPRTAAKIGSENLQKPEVAAAIQEALKRREERTELKADDVLRELWRIATVDIGEAFDADGRLKPLKDIPVDVRRAIAAVEVQTIGGEEGIALLHKVKFWDKKGALDSLGRHFALFKDKLEVTGSFADVLKAARERAQRR